MDSTGEEKELAERTQEGVIDRVLQVMDRGERAGA
jgi:hypothetical protein